MGLIDARVSGETYCRGMRCLGGGVTIITSRHGCERSGLTATAVCSLSINPARLLACVNISGATYQLVVRSRHAVVNILTKQQEEIARCFAGMSGECGEDRFSLGQWGEGRSGSPVLRGALASFDCAISEMIVTQTHAILIAEVMDVVLGDQEPPLIYLHGAFMTAAAL